MAIVLMMPRRDDYTRLVRDRTEPQPCTILAFEKAKRAPKPREKGHDWLELLE